MRTGPSYQGVFFDGATINPEANHVLAKFNIVAGVPEDEVRKQVREYHSINKIPFGQIVSIKSSRNDDWTLSDDWTVFVKYVGAPITEAKYAGKYKNQDVVAQYRKKGPTHDQDVSLLSTRIHEAPSGNYVITRFIVNLDDEQDVRDALKDYHDRHGLPLGEIEGINHYGDEWDVYIVYRGL